MDDGLVLKLLILMILLVFSLNPCCNGRWSRTDLTMCKVGLNPVLILVVMDDGFVRQESTFFYI